MRTIKYLRNDVDKIDAAIVKKIAQRNKLVMQIGKLKLQSKKPLLDQKRESELMRYYVKLSAEYQLQPEFVKQLFKLIIMQSKQLQRQK